MSNVGKARSLPLSRTFHVKRASLRQSMVLLEKYKSRLTVSKHSGLFGVLYYKTFYGRNLRIFVARECLSLASLSTLV
jgi:hypothetical protein